MIKTKRQIKDSFKIFGGILCYLIGVGFVFWQLSWWYNNPELTEMQVFHEWWAYDLVITFVVILGFKLGKSDDN